jgi:hypothetical protein
MTDVQRLAVKITLKPRVLNEEYLRAIRTYVTGVQRLTQTAYLLIKFIFLQEADNARFGLLSVPLKQELFVECLQALNNSQSLPSLRCGETARYYRQAICHYLPLFRDLYQPAARLNRIIDVQQTCLYQARAMITMFLNHYEKHLITDTQRAINQLFTRRESESVASSQERREIRA